MPDSFLVGIDAFICNESAMGIIQVCKLEGNTKVFRATKGTQRLFLGSFPGKDVISLDFLRFKYFKKPQPL